MPVQVETDAGVTVLTLDRPDVLNAFDEEMGLDLLAKVIAASEDSEVRCIVITGAGRAFCAGEDLGALAQDYASGNAPKLSRTLDDRYNPLIRALRAAPKPVLAAVNGVAAGAGVSLALACDFRIASSKAKLVLAFIKVGLVPDSGALWFLTRMIGSARTWELAATGDPMTAEEALRSGVINRIVEPDDFESAWRAWATELAAGPTKAYALTKELTNKAGEVTLDEQLELEADAQRAAGQSKDHMEGVTAFFAKRPPNFTGE
jgi:2-(1,2-epoxy-1,2-dihydrophenyl)acetyl-CoA isomerase